MPGLEPPRKPSNSVCGRSAGCPHCREIRNLCSDRHRQQRRRASHIECPPLPFQEEVDTGSQATAAPIGRRLLWSVLLTATTRQSSCGDRNAVSAVLFSASLIKQTFILRDQRPVTPGTRQGFRSESPPFDRDSSARAPVHRERQERWWRFLRPASARMDAKPSVWIGIPNAPGWTTFRNVPDFEM